MSTQPTVLIRLTPKKSGMLLHLVVERICELRNNWSRTANAERKQLNELRRALEEGLTAE